MTAAMSACLVEGPADLPDRLGFWVGLFAGLLVGIVIAAVHRDIEGRD